MIAKVILPIALMTVMFGIGLGLRWKDFSQLSGRWQLLVSGLSTQLLMLPFLALMVGWVFALPAEYLVGLLIVSLAPGGATSNMVTLLARGAIPLSVVLTFMTGLITPVTLPLVTAFSMEYMSLPGFADSFPTVPVMLKLFMAGALPVIFGVLTAYKWPVVATKIYRIVKPASVAFMLFAVISVVLSANQWGEVLQVIWLPVLTMVVLAIATGVLVSLIAGASSAERVTLGIEIGFQNAAIAMMAGMILQNDVVVLVALSYGVLMNLPAALMILWRNPQWIGLRQQKVVG